MDECFLNARLVRFVYFSELFMICFAGELFGPEDNRGGRT